jgi:hypothetical protein
MARSWSDSDEITAGEVEAFLHEVDEAVGEHELNLLETNEDPRGVFVMDAARR